MRFDATDCVEAMPVLILPASLNDQGLPYERSVSVDIQQHFDSTRFHPNSKPSVVDTGIVCIMTPCADCSGTVSVLPPGSYLVISHRLSLDSCSGPGPWCTCLPRSFTGATQAHRGRRFPNASPISAAGTPETYSSARKTPRQHLQNLNIRVTAAAR